MGYDRQLACPKCGAGHGLGVYNDNGQYNGKCHACGELFWDIDPDNPEYVPARPPAGQPQPAGFKAPTVEEISRYPIMPIPGRWTREAAEYFEVRATIGPTGQPVAIHYPYFHRKTGQLMAYKTRRLNVPKDQAFSIVGDIKECGLFGSHKYRDAAGEDVICVEGEDDTGAAFDMLQRTGRPMRVVSLISGATINKDGKGVLDRGNLAEMPWLGQFKNVYLAFDGDEPGHACMVAAAEELAGVCNVFFVTHSEKDARDLQNNGKAGEWLKAVLNANRYKPFNLVSGEEIELEELLTPMEKGLPLPWPKLQYMLMGLRCGASGGELTLLCAGANMGKTTLCRELQYFLAVEAGIKQGCIFLEEQHIKSAQGFIAMHHNVPLAEFRLNPALIPREQAEQAKAATVDKMIFHRHFGSMASESLINEMMYMHREGCRVIALDHISLLVSGLESSRQGERKDIDLLLTKLATFVTVTGVHVLAVVQLKRRQGNMKKDKEGNLDPDTAPYNRGGRVDLDDLRGSGAFEHLAHNIFALEGNDSPEDGQDPHLRWLRVLKNREWGRKGLADFLRYNDRTGRLTLRPGG